MFCLQLIDALESHVSTIRATLRRKLIKEGVQSGLIPRAASMAVEVRTECCVCVCLCGFWERLVYGATIKKLMMSAP